MSPLDDTTLAKINEFANQLKPLYPNIKTAYEIANDAKNLLPVKAPYYFMLSSEEQDNYLQNIGFLWQQMDLFLSSLSLGSCWLGMAKPTAGIHTKYPFTIALCFGKPEEPPHRDLTGFKRKPLEEISCGSDSRLEAARLAPSATNSQNWFFDCQDNGIDVYQKKLNPAMNLLYGKMNSIDMGIALCHLYFATKEKGSEFVFEQLPNKSKKGYTYIGSVK